MEHPEMNDAIYTHLHIAPQYSAPASGVLCTRQPGTLQLPTDQQHPYYKVTTPVVISSTSVKDLRVRK